MKSARDSLQFSQPQLLPWRKKEDCSLFPYMNFFKNFAELLSACIIAVALLLNMLTNQPSNFLESSFFPHLVIFKVGEGGDSRRTVRR